MPPRDTLKSELPESLNGMVCGNWVSTDGKTGHPAAGGPDPMTAALIRGKFECRHAWLQRQRSGGVSASQGPGEAGTGRKDSRGLGGAEPPDTGAGLPVTRPGPHHHEGRGRGGGSPSFSTRGAVVAAGWPHPGLIQGPTAAASSSTSVPLRGNRGALAGKA